MHYRFKLLFTLSLTLFFTFSIVANNTAQTKRKQLFDFNWKFSKGDISNAQAVSFDDSGWRKLDLPHDWSIEGKPEKTNPSGGPGGYFPTGIGWYRKTFTVPENWKGKEVSIHFGGVYENSDVFINGKSLGFHPYGFTPFSYDLTGSLNYGGKNTIAVRVDNSHQINCRWYSGSGIYRHVWLVVTNPVHIAHWGVAIETPKVSTKQATVSIKAQIKNQTNHSQSIEFTVQLKDAKTKTVGKNTIQVELAANSEKEVAQTIQVKNPSLWTPATPYIYTANFQIKQREKVIDHFKNTFGIRTLKFTAKDGFQLNGKVVKLDGGCVHHDDGCLGAKAFDRAEDRKVELLKEAGFNAVRTAHNPPSEEFLNACDRLGIMVIDEAFDGWRKAKNKYDYSLYFDKWSKRDLQSMVLRDRNHPSVIMWSIGNEIIERKSPDAVKTAKMLAGYVHDIDLTRPVTSAMTTWDNTWQIYDSLMAAHDVCGYNYQLFRAESDHKRVPSRIIVQTESYPRNAFKNWNLVQNHKYIIGDFVWTAMDYLGESGIGRSYYPGEPKGEHWEADLFPWHGAYCGDIDITGWRKPISHYRDITWNNTEKLYMGVREPNPDNGKITETLWAVWPSWESWTWPGKEGKTIQVEIYSKYPKVRLYLNNKLIGEKATTKAQQYKAIFPVPYTPGILKAVGVENNKEVETQILRTAGAPAKIELTADRSTISANREDLSFVTINILDKNGIKQPNANNELHFKISGPGVIEGVCNANMKDTDSYVGTSRKAWKGRALVVIKSTNKKGKIKLTVSSDNLKSNSIIIKSK